VSEDNDGRFPDDSRVEVLLGGGPAPALHAHPRSHNGTNTPTLLARSRHASVRSPERYARPGPEAVAPSRRRHRPRPAPAASPVTSPRPGV